MNVKEAKTILKTHPHKWYYDKFGSDMVCGVCGCNAEGQQYEAIRVPIKTLSQKKQKSIMKLIKKYGPEIFDYDGYYVNTHKSYFRIKLQIQDEGGDYEKYDYEFPQDYDIVKCKNCEELMKVYAHCYKAFPFWIKFRDRLHWTLLNLRPYVIKNHIGKKFGIFGWEKEGPRKHPLFDNKKIKTNYNTEKPWTWAECLIYGYDHKLERYSYIIGYYYPDTEKFYIGTDCLKENDLETKWDFEIQNWALLRYMKEEEFNHRS